MEFLSIDLINYILFGIIIFLTVLIVVLIFHFIINKNDVNQTLVELNKRFSSLESSETSLFESFQAGKNKKKGKKAHEEPLDPSIRPGQILLDFDRICNDMVIKDNGSMSAMVLKCSAINLDMMSEEEKLSVQKNFVLFIESLTSPIKIYIQTRVMHYDDNFSSYEQKIGVFERELRELMNTFNKSYSTPNYSAKERTALAKKLQVKQNLFAYAKNLQAQIETIGKTNLIHENNYYIITTVSVNDLELKGNFKNEQNLGTAYDELNKRCEHIIQGLKKCGVEAVILDSYQIAELLCSSFLSEDKDLLKLRDAMAAGFFKLYSSAAKK